MAVNISKLWSNRKFTNLTQNTKLFYIYLVSHPNINLFGVLELDLELFTLQTNMTVKEIRSSSTELIKNQLIHVKKYEGVVYIIIPAHFTTVGSAESTIQRMTIEYDSFPEELKEFLESINISLSRKISKFKKPDIKEIYKFSIQKGFLIDPNEFFNFYENSSERFGITDHWVDGRGKRVRDWKNKLVRVWGRPEKKAKVIPNAPKGFESFYIYDSGNFHQPSYWEGGLPKHKDYLISRNMVKAFKELKDGN